MLKLNFTSYSRFFIKKKILKELQRATSTQPAVQDAKEKFDKQLKDSETLTNITRKQRIKKPQKPPFVKNLLVGIFDTDILTYPELQKEDVENIEKDAIALRKLMNQEHMINCTTFSDKTFRQNLADYKAIGIQASQFLDGRESNVTESLRLLESLSEHELRTNIVANEQLAVQILVKFASDALKKKYLHPLMKGEWLSAVCLFETEDLNPEGFQTKATISQDGKTLVLNGEKSLVINGNSADIFVVFALTKTVMNKNLKEVKLSALLVEKDFNGISIQKNDAMDLDIATVTFNDTPVPVDNLIGEIHNAEVILIPIISEYRLSIASMSMVLTKKILNNLSESVIKKSNNTNMLVKTDAIREKIAEISTSLYAMESVTYLTSGLIDNYENQDCHIECAIAKLFCSECALKASNISLDLSGSLAISQSYWARRLHDQVLPFLTLHEANDRLKILIALLGIQHAGEVLNEKIKMIRNPFTYSTFAIKKMWHNRHLAEDNPKLNLRLNEYLHPSLLLASQHLEYCVKKIEFVTEVLLSRYGPEIISRHMELRRLGDCLVDTYALAACVGRASRAYCVGLQFSDHEILLANTFSINAKERVRINSNMIQAGYYQTNDENYRLIAKRLFQSKGYFPLHPLTRNF